uniref:Aldo-keto reductase n=1 Tax=Cyberlindnera americana TaxID=36016 RepID=A0A5P8N946_9ASCO|nr:aldo-keto reductase [Cyberlindnera americana]
MNKLFKNSLKLSKMAVPQVPSFKLTSGQSIPAIGFGSGTAWRIQKTSADSDGSLITGLIDQTKQAIKCGYMHIDTAEAYFTHEEVGLGIKAADIAREKLFVVDKWSPGCYEKTKSSGPYESLTTALKEMGLDYVDCYLIHHPIKKTPISLEDAWKEMEKLVAEGLTKSIGVSNFDVEGLEQIKKFANIQPVVNQIEFHAYLQDQTPGIVEYCQKNNILIEGFCPLAPIMRAAPGPVDDLLPQLAEKYGKSETQILLRWVYEHGILPLTTSSKAERLAEALDIFTFELEKADIEKISEVGKSKIFRAFYVDIYNKHDTDEAK